MDYPFVYYEFRQGPSFTEGADTRMGYGVDEAIIHDGECYDALNTALTDLPFYTKWCSQAGPTVLELCCGTGRLTVPLSKAGLQVFGLDANRSMLSRQAEKARAAGLDIPLVRADMRRFSLNRRFHSIIIPFNSLQNTYTREDFERISKNVKAHLAPAGLWLFDVFNPDISLMVDRAGPPRKRYAGTLPDGTALTVAESCHYLAAGQVNRVTWECEIGSRRSTATLDMRCFFPRELAALLHYNGWTIRHCFGDFDESTFTGSSPKQIFVCQVES